MKIDNKFKGEKMKNVINFISVCNKKKYYISLSIILSYSIFYITRLNFSLIPPYLIEQFSFTKTQIGAILSSFSIIYGLGKFVSGYLCDHTSPKWFLVFGLIGIC